MAIAKAGNLRKKITAAAKALEFLPKKGAVGLGSGTTVEVFADMVPPGSGPGFYCVSKNAEKILRKKGLRVLKKCKKVDVAFDGADAFVKGGVVKGLGGLDFVAEKKLDYNAKKLVFVVDSGKLKKRENVTVFAETVKGNSGKVRETLKGMGLEAVPVSPAKTKKFGKKNDFIRISAGKKTDFKKLEKKLDSVKGVLGSGIFTRKKFIVVIGYKNKAVVKK